MGVIKRFLTTMRNIVVSVTLLFVGLYVLGHMSVHSVSEQPRTYQDQPAIQSGPWPDVVFIDLPMDNMTWHLPQCESNELGVVGPYMGRRLDDGRWGMAEMCLPTD